MNDYRPINPYIGAYPNNQYQQMQPTIPMVNPLNGRIVSDFSQITANDVRMDGNVSIFPKSDFSEICCRYWNNDGTIKSIVYKPILATLPNEPTNLPTNTEKSLETQNTSILQDIMERLTIIEKKFDDLGNSRKTQVKKVESNE